MKDKSSADLSALMGISANLADLNHARYQTMSWPLTPDNASHAALTFAGDTYVGLDAKSLSDADLNYAQDTLGILSGLYGLLRPLDLMQPYRLEMGTRLSVGEQKDSTPSGAIRSRSVSTRLPRAMQTKQSSTWHQTNTSAQPAKASEWVRLDTGFQGSP